MTAQFAEARAAGAAWPIPDAYAIANTSQRVVNLILGATRLSAGWDGRRPRGDG